MFKVTVIDGKQNIVTECEDGALLSTVLDACGVNIAHPCGGRGVCRKCRVRVNGADELSCRYEIHSDIVAEIYSDGETSFKSGGETADDVFFCLDIGTTAVALSLCAFPDGREIASAVFDNPQRQYGADIMSRISYCSENGPGKLNSVLISRLNTEIEKLLRSAGKDRAEKLFAAGNTTMLHLFLNKDCSSLGAAPYTPLFLDGQNIGGAECGIEKVGEIITLPCVGAFIGADIVSGLGYISKSASGYTLFADLGTNAEIALFAGDKILCASAAAGPCFEGANISCGMSAKDGAICAYRDDGSFSVIGGVKPEGICATGLIDIISVLLEKNIIEESGYTAFEKYEITDDIYLSREDIRQYQLAKSAVRAALTVLVSAAGITFDDIDRFFVAGGFSEKLNMKNAVRSGLFPAALEDKFIPVNNSSLKGLAAYALGENPPSAVTGKAVYYDLAEDAGFPELFISGMSF